MNNIEEKVLEYFTRKDIIKEQQEQVAMLKEEIEQLITESDEDEWVFQLPNGEYAVLSLKATVKDVFDREGLARELLVVEDELKTFFDVSMFTAQGKLTPDMISKHTTTETQVKPKISKRKTKPRKKTS